MRLMIKATLAPAAVAALAVLTVCTLGGVTSGPVSAATIANADGKPYTISIIEQSRKRDVRLETGAKLERICIEGCRIRINGDAAREFLLEGTERVSVEDGLVYYDGEVAKPKTGAQPATK
ncbi:MAG: hypothetical protein KDJ36_16595 [Hyphomicrobiaceae bacterium]|nr:hypothetical protein [Hyphomicrobiaceae bacterium]